MNLKACFFSPDALQLAFGIGYTIFQSKGCRMKWWWSRISITGRQNGGEKRRLWQLLRAINCGTSHSTFVGFFLLYPADTIGKDFNPPRKCINIASRYVSARSPLPNECFGMGAESISPSRRMDAKITVKGKRETHYISLNKELIVWGYPHMRAETKKKRIRDIRTESLESIGSFLICYIYIPKRWQ